MRVKYSAYNMVYTQLTIADSLKQINSKMEKIKK